MKITRQVHCSMPSAPLVHNIINRIFISGGKDNGNGQHVNDEKKELLKQQIDNAVHGLCPNCRRRAILSENSRAILSSAPNVCCRVAAGLK